MTNPDQYRREGAEAMRQRAAQILDHYDEYDRQLCCDGQMCGCQGSTVHQMIQYFIRAIDVDDVLADTPPRCAECDCEDGNCTWIKASPAPDAVEQLVSNADRLLPEFLATAARNVDFDGPWDDFDLSGGLRAVIAAMETDHDG